MINRFIGSLVEKYSQKSQKIIRRIRKLRVLIRKMHVRIAMVVQTYYLMQYFKGFIWISSEIGKNMNISTNWASLHVNSYRWVCKQRTVLLVKHKSSYLYVLKRGKQQHCCGINSYLNTSSWYANKVNAIRHPLLVFFLF